MSQYEITIEGVGVVGHYNLDPMPGCPKVGISSHLEIYSPHRGKRYAYPAMEDRIRLARESGFQILLCTVVVGNVPQEKVMRKFRFREVSWFDNETTGNRIRLWYKNLTDPYDCGFFEPGGCR
jgi:hypothetical protein